MGITEKHEREIMARFAIMGAYDRVACRLAPVNHFAVYAGDKPRME